jgi:hypothetical protein
MKPTGDFAQFGSGDCWGAAPPGAGWVALLAGWIPGEAAVSGWTADKTIATRQRVCHGMEKRPLDRHVLRQDDA